jgi:hypothetical protein
MGHVMTGTTSVPVDVRCGTVAGVEVASLPTLARVVDLCLERGRLGCELAAGHDGAHAALAATGCGGDQWWWLRWDGQHEEVIQIDPCAAELVQEPYVDCCILPDGHVGRHSFDLAPLPTSPG